MDETRKARLEHRIQHELSDLLMRGEIKDSRVPTLVSFSFVKLARDASSARVGVSTILDDDRLGAAVEGLNRAAGFLQSRIGRMLRTRATPRLYFVADRSIAEGQDVIRRIDEAVRADQAASGSRVDTRNDDPDSGSADWSAASR